MKIVQSKKVTRIVFRDKAEVLSYLGAARQRGTEVVFSKRAVAAMGGAHAGFARAQGGGQGGGLAGAI